MLTKLRDGPLGLPSVECGEIDNEERGTAAALAMSELALPAEDRERLIKWAQAHAVLLPVFANTTGELDQLMASPLNASHFGALATLAGHVHSLSLTDEAYLAPLRDLKALGDELRAEAWFAKASTSGQHPESSWMVEDLGLRTGKATN